MKEIIRNIAKHKKIKPILVCFFLAFLSWTLITLSQTYRHKFVLSIFFVLEENEKIVDSSNDELFVEVETNGFEMLYRYWFHKKKNIFIELEKLPIEIEKGEAEISSQMLLPFIEPLFSFSSSALKVSSQTFSLRWRADVSKRVKVVSHVDVQPQLPYGLYSPLKIEPEWVTIEGSQEVLATIDEIHTEELKFASISQTTTFVLPLKQFDDTLGVRVLMPWVLCHAQIEEFTEGELDLAIYNRNEEVDYKVKFLPAKIKLTYRVALKDYSIVNGNDFEAFVRINEEMLNRQYLPIEVETFLDLPISISYYPKKVEYIIFR